MEIDNIYNMDCLEGMKQIPDGSVDAVITSPPYNFCLRVRGENYTRRSKNEEFGHTGQKMNKYINGLTDDLDMEDYFNWQCECIDQMMRISKGVVFYNIQLITGNKVAVFQIIGKYADCIREVLIWDKRNASQQCTKVCSTANTNLSLPSTTATAKAVNSGLPTGSVAPFPMF